MSDIDFQRLRELMAELGMLENAHVARAERYGIQSPPTVQTRQAASVSHSHLTQGQDVVSNTKPAVQDQVTDEELLEILQARISRSDNISSPARIDTMQDDSSKSSDMAEPASSVKSKQPVTFPDIGYHKGDRAERDSSVLFCPLRLVSHYVDWYVGKRNTPLVTPYFGHGTFLAAQRWDFFYLYNTSDNSVEPFVLLLTDQFRHFLDTINEELGINLSIPIGHETAKFKISFADFRSPNSPRPRYLGQAADPEAFRELVDNVPAPHPEDNANKLAGLDHTLFQAIWRNMKSSIDEKPKGKRPSHKKTMRASMHKGWGHATKRVQRYLGLRRKISETEENAFFTGQKPQISELNLDEPSPFSPEDSVVFICVDCEVYEKNHSAVTEIGFAILDTQDLRGIAPGDDGKQWFEKIQGRHLRVKERAHLVNTEYVRGCPDNFNFGGSEFVAHKDARSVIEQILSQNKFPSEDRPHVVLVGHDVQNDIVHLSKIGIDVNKFWNIREIIDNQGLQQFMRQMSNGQRLQTLLVEFNIPHSYLHNAGNDAVYTLQSLIVLAVRQRQASLHRALKAEPDSDEDNLSGTNEGWSSGGEGCDGGAPPPRRPQVA